MKKYISLLLVLLILAVSVALGACGKTDETPSSAGDASGEASAQASEPAKDEGSKAASGDEKPFEYFDVDKDVWTEVTPATGFWQGGAPTTNATISYKYCYKIEDGMLYGAAIIDCPLAEGGNGDGTNFRTWFHHNPDATVYTHFIDVYYKSGKTITWVKKNGSLTANKDAAVVKNSGVTATMKGIGDKSYAEFEVPLESLEADVNGKVEMFICCSNKADSEAENVCLFHAGVAGEEWVNANMPYGLWDQERAVELDIPEE